MIAVRCLRLLSAGLTNVPNLDLAAVAASAQPNQQEPDMIKIAAALGLGPACACDLVHLTPPKARLVLKQAGDLGMLIKGDIAVCVGWQSDMELLGINQAGKRPAVHAVAAANVMASVEVELAKRKMPVLTSARASPFAPGFTTWRSLRPTTFKVASRATTACVGV